nr:reverse transcriptase domain-containing protein [Tanacetum cinerariifolium]
ATLEEGVSKMMRMLMEEKKMRWALALKVRQSWMGSTRPNPESCGNWVKSAGSKFGLLDFIFKSAGTRDADKSQNGEDNHDSGTGVRRQAPLARECTYQDFMKCKPLYFKGQKPTCFECGAQRHFKRECLKLKNKNHGNQGGNGNAPAKVYAVGHAGTNLDSNVITGTFLLNNRYASILFDTGADRSFVSTALAPKLISHQRP